MNRLILYLLIIYGVTVHSQNTEILFQNYSVKKNLNQNNLLHFDNANYNDNLLPFTTKEVKGFNRAENIKIEYINCTNEEINLLKEHDISSKFTIKTTHNYSRNEKITSFISPYMVQSKPSMNFIKPISRRK